MPITVPSRMRGTPSILRRLAPRWNDRKVYSVSLFGIVDEHRGALEKHARTKRPTTRLVVYAQDRLLLLVGKTETLRPPRKFSPTPRWMTAMSASAQTNR